MLAGLALAAWPGRSRAAASATLRIGALRGPQADLLRFAVTLPQAKRLTAVVTEADDKAALAQGLSAGLLDAIASHDSQEIDAFNATHGTALATGFPTVTLPFGIYARHLHAVSQLRSGDRIVLPAAQADYDRARVLLYNYGLLFAHEDDGLSADFSNIVNPRGFVLDKADPQALAGQIDRAAAVVMPYAVANAAGAHTAPACIGQEDGKSPYTQVLAVRAADRAQPWLATLARAVQSREMRQFIYHNYGDTVEPPW